MREVFLKITKTEKEMERVKVDNSEQQVNSIK